MGKNKDYGHECKCGQFFASETALTSHKNFCKLRSSTSKKCDHCEKTFDSFRQLHDHFRIISGINRVECEICKITFATKPTLKRHMKRRHPNNQPIPSYPFACEICNKTYRTEAFLKRHKKTYHSERVACSICSMSLSNKGTLREHMIRKHRDDYFNNKRREKIEKEKQKEERENSVKNDCVMCGRMFKYQSQLFLHLLMHTREAPNICPFKDCQKEYRHIVNLGDHLVNMHGSEGRKICEKLKLNKCLGHKAYNGRYPCSICSKIYTKSIGMPRHVVGNHGGNIANGKKVRDERIERNKCSKDGGPPLTDESTGTKVSTKQKKKEKETQKKAGDTKPLPPVHNICYLCGAHFICRALCRLHVKWCEEEHAIFLTNDNQKPETLCPVCSKIITKLTVRGKRDHILECGGIKTCPVCKIDITEMDKRKRDGHVGRCRRRQKHKCPNCPQTFTQKWYLSKHIELRRCKIGIPKKYKCSTCPATYSQKSSILSHIRQGRCPGK